MAVPLAEFEPVLNAFLGVDNTARSAAHQYLNQLRTGQPDTLLLSLLQVLRQSSQQKFRSLAADHGSKTPLGIFPLPSLGPQLYQDLQ